MSVICSLFGSILYADCSFLSLICWLLSVICSILSLFSPHAFSCLLYFLCWLFCLVSCQSSVLCILFYCVYCIIFVVCCLLPIVLSVVCCLLYSILSCLSSFFVVCSLLSVLCFLLSVFSFLLSLSHNLFSLFLLFTICPFDCFLHFYFLWPKNSSDSVSQLTFQLFLFAVYVIDNQLK